MRPEELSLQDCPLCGGAAAMFEEGGCAFTVQCCDCGAHTAHSMYKTPEGRQAAAQAAADTWNFGKVIHPGPGE